MKRSSFITWDQLKVGVLIVIALIIMGVAIVKLGQAGNLFGKRYTLVSYVGSAAGLRIGGPVTVAGQLAGSIKDIKFLPPDADTTRNLELLVEINYSVRNQVRQDSRAKIAPRFVREFRHRSRTRPAVAKENRYALRITVFAERDRATFRQH